MEEKKLTDEEIAKAILQSIEYRKTITYFDEWGNCKSIFVEDALDLIHRLQGEDEQLRKAKVIHETVDYCYEDLKNAKAEIERLTEYNENLNGMCLEFTDKNAELQKQVDELKAQNEWLTNEKDYLKQCADAFLGDYKNSVKDTAKEILQGLWDETEPNTKSHEWVRKRIKEIANRRGVEVE